MLLALAVAALLSSAFGQSESAAPADDLQDSIEFQVEMYRVDLYRDDQGDEVERLVEVTDAVRGQEIEFQVTAVNEGDRIYRPYEFLATMDIPEGLVYLEGTAEDEDGTFLVEYSADGGESFVEAGEPGAPDPAEIDTIQWVYTERFEPGDEITFSYRVTVQ